MPIKTIDLTTAPGFIIQTCVCCPGSEHRIAFDRGAAETKEGPFKLAVEDTLEVKIDGAAAVTVTFGAGDFPDFDVVTAPQLAGKLAGALAAATVTNEQCGDGDESVLIESSTTGPQSRVEVAGGSARTALGFSADGSTDPCAGRPVLGISLGQLKNKDAIAFRRCGCGANEIVTRTWDVAPAGLGGQAFYEQRKAVNALAQYFKANGWIHPDVLAAVNAETGSPPDIATGLPGVVLSPPLPGPPAPIDHVGSP